MKGVRQMGALGGWGEGVGGTLRDAALESRATSLQATHNRRSEKEGDSDDNTEMTRSSFLRAQVDARLFGTAVCKPGQLCK